MLSSGERYVASPVILRFRSSSRAYYTSDLRVSMNGDVCHTTVTSCHIIEELVRGLQTDGLLATWVSVSPDSEVEEQTLIMTKHLEKGWLKEARSRHAPLSIAGQAFIHEHASRPTQSRPTHPSPCCLQAAGLKMWRPFEEGPAPLNTSYRWRVLTR